MCDPGAAPLPRTAGAPAIVTAISPALPLVFAAVLVQQIVVSALAVESQPFISNFPMYSHTYLTRQDFNAHLRRSSAFVIITAPTLTASETARRLSEFCDLDEVVYPAIDQAIGQDTGQDVREPLRRVLSRYEEKYGALGALSVVVRERRFDWERGEFERSPRVTFEGTIDLERVAAGG